MQDGSSWIQPSDASTATTGARTRKALSMHWRKLGHVYTAGGETTWAQTHAFLPTPAVLDEDRIRVYVSFRDRHGTGRIGFVDVSAAEPRRVLRVSQRPVLDIGANGTFDDSGVNPIAAVHADGVLHLFYNGWQIPRKVRYAFFLGLATSTDGGETFVRRSEVPVLDRVDGELFFRSGACILREGPRWRMWYIGGDRWEDVKGKALPRYSLRYLESDRLDSWSGPGRLLMEPAGDDEHGFGRPVVTSHGDHYRMWYGVRTRSRGYHTGYAESRDGLGWTRRDELAGIDVSAAGWDSQMICCHGLAQTRLGTYLFYNGNNYGETGFGVAVLEE